MDDYHELLRTVGDRMVREEMLRLVQAWAHAFRNEPAYRAVAEEMRVMKHEGFQFPVLKESDAMFDASTAPQWADGEVCHRCRAGFTVVMRKHHCRNCGQVFCGKCTTKSSTIPKYGIEKEVRVCDVCYDKLNKKEKKTTEVKTVDMSKKSVATSSKGAAKKVDKDDEEAKKLQAQEEEELALALALSKSEAESKEHDRSMHTLGSYSLPKSTTKLKKRSSKSGGSRSTSTRASTTETTPTTSTTKKTAGYPFPAEAEMNELERYLNRDYWEQRASLGADHVSASPSAPQPTSIMSTGKGSSAVVDTFQSNQTKVQPLKDSSSGGTTTNGESIGESDKKEQELMQFATDLRSTIEIFMNRLNSNKVRGRAITNDHGVQAMFINLTNQHANLVGHMRQTNEARTDCERLQDKITQVRDARAALDALREEHREQLRREAEAADRVRQQQMAQKLEILRKKKQEYQQYQQQLAMQRMQEQERGIMMNAEQYKYSNNPANNQWGSPMAAPTPYGGQAPAPAAAPPAGYYAAAPNAGYPAQQPSMPMNGQQQHSYGQQPPMSHEWTNMHPQPPVMMNPGMSVPPPPPVASMPPMTAYGGGVVGVQPPSPAVVPQQMMPAPYVYNPVGVGAVPVHDQQQPPPPPPPQQQVPPKEEELLISFE